jgi:glycosyltransferase involved in cell wall biosynthesis
MTDQPRILALFGARVIFGQERANIAALAALRSEGCDVLCVIRPETWPELLELRAMLEVEGLAWTTAPYIDYPLRGWLLRVATHNPGAYISGNAALKRIASNFGATHIHAFNPLYVASFYSALRALRLPIVYRAGDKPVRHNPFYRWIWRFIVDRTAHFVADSQFIRRELEKSGVPPERITVLYAPPPRRSGAVRDSHGDGLKDRDGVRFVFVGQVVADKGVDLLVAAFERLAGTYPECELLVAGRISDWAGDAWARDLRDRTAANAAVRDRVRFLGHVEDAPNLVERCHVHVAPSVKEEPYGLVVVEAKSAGRPSIIFASGGMAELVEDGVDGAVVTDRTVEGLARAMELYAATPDLAARQGVNARASLEKLRLDLFAATWRQVYENAVSRPADA